MSARRRKPDLLHRYGIRVPESLWRKIVEEHWRSRKSINQVIVDLLAEKLA